jgi:hypothetical protein
LYSKESNGCLGFINKYGSDDVIGKRQEEKSCISFSSTFFYISHKFMRLIINLNFDYMKDV